MKTWNNLVDASAPWVFKSVEKFDVEKFDHLQSEDAPQLVEISGLYMKDSLGFYLELSRAFSFPAYSGHNLNALFDSLTDLVCMTESGLLLVIHDLKLKRQIAKTNILISRCFHDDLSRHLARYFACRKHFREK